MKLQSTYFNTLICSLLITLLLASLNDATVLGEKTEPSWFHEAVRRIAEARSRINAYDVTITGKVDSTVERVELTDGTFTGDGNRDIRYWGKAITIESQGGEPDDCIVDSQGSPSDPHRGFDFLDQEGPDAVLRGVTVTGGWTGLSPTGAGCGIQNGSSPTIDNCVFSNNSSEDNCGAFDVWRFADEGVIDDGRAFGASLAAGLQPTTIGAAKPGAFVDALAGHADDIDLIPFNLVIRDEDVNGPAVAGLDDHGDPVFWFLEFIVQISREVMGGVLVPRQPGDIFRVVDEGRASAAARADFISNHRGDYPFIQKITCEVL